jgi:hypothetical protein
VARRAALPRAVRVAASWRAPGARLACALVLGVALLNLRRVLSEGVEAAGVSALDTARRTGPPGPAVPHHALELASDVRTAARSRRYLEDVLWPRLEALAGRSLTPPRRRRGRGPSLASLRALIMDIERRP